MSSMFRNDARSPIFRIVAGVAGLTMIGWGLQSILIHGDLHYTNWFGELIFEPLAILFGLIAVGGALFKPEILGGTAVRKK
ncbi:MAG: hypothetical protein WAN03_08765 [Candidatus Sulfotelmatobacter sp.]